MIKAIATDTPQNARHANAPAEEFSAFMVQVEPRLRRAVAGAVGTDAAPDAVAEAFAWAWQHWDRVRDMANPAGYLYRVARSQSRVRPLKRVKFLVEVATTLPDVEPALPDALLKLPERQRTVVWLVYACEWSYAEVAEALEISASAVGTHASRGIATLRSSLGALHD